MAANDVINEMKSHAKGRQLANALAIHTRTRRMSNNNAFGLRSPRARTCSLTDNEYVRGPCIWWKANVMFSTPDDTATAFGLRRHCANLPYGRFLRAVEFYHVRPFREDFVAGRCVCRTSTTTSERAFIQETIATTHSTIRLCGCVAGWSKKRECECECHVRFS